MKTGVKLILTTLIAAFLFSCEKSELPEIHSPFDPVPEKAASSKFSKIIQSPLKSTNDFEGFNDIFLGNWHVLEVVTLNPLGQWIYLDYSSQNIEYSFQEDCRYMNPGEMYCRFESTHSADPSGIFEVRLEDNKQKLFLKSDLSSLSLDNSYWGDLYHWPASPNIMIVHKPEAPFWIIMEEVYVE